jgi:hypothetical protein
VDLYINNFEFPHWQEFENIPPWLDLMRPFGAVKKLYISEDSAPHIVPALQLVGGRMRELLPSLQNIFLEELHRSGPAQEGIRQFVAMQQVTSHPIPVSPWFRIYGEGDDDDEDEDEVGLDDERWMGR